jgi:hypothetical protein
LHAPAQRAFAIEGTGSFGAGLTRFLTSRDERVLEVGRLRRERRSGGKTDALDAIRAARSVLAQRRPAEPRAGGEGEALRALMAAREGAVNAKRAGLCQLRDLLVTTPEPLRSELRPLTRAQLLRRLAAVRPTPPRRRAARRAAGPTHGRAPRPTPDRRRARARARDRDAHTHAGTATARPAGRRPARGRPARHLLVAPRPDQKRGRLRSPLAAHRSPPRQSKRSATASTAAATANSTAPCT